MTLYFDIRVQNPETSSINTNAIWHTNFPLLAVTSFSHNKGGYVRIYDDHGEPLQDAEPSEYVQSQVTALHWHPEKRLLVAGWETGALKFWNGDIRSSKFYEIPSPHKNAISILQWSQRGGRLVSADLGGIVIGWMMDSQNQLRIMFRHDLNEALTHIAFKVSTKQLDAGNSAAKSLHPEDENTRNIFSSWRPRTAVQTAASIQKDVLTFFIGSSEGSIYYIDAKGQYLKVLNTDTQAILGLLYHQLRDSLIVMTGDFTISQYQVDTTTGNLSELIKIKMTSKSSDEKPNAALYWIGINTLAILSGELSIQCWNLQTGDTYVLTVPDTQTKNSETSAETCTSLSFCEFTKTLAAGTNLGTIYFWKRKTAVDTDENGWTLMPKNCIVQGTVRQLTWGGAFLRNPLLAVNCLTNVFILYEQAMCIAYNEDIFAKQISATQLLLDANQQVHIVKTDIQIQILGLNCNFLAVSSGRQITIYRIYQHTSLHTVVEHYFNCDTEKILIYESTLIILTSTHIQLRTIDGNIIQSLPTLPEEGEPIAMELTSHYLTVASLNGILKIWDLSRREAKLHTRAMAIYEVISDFSEVIEAKCNINCRCVSITVATSNFLPSSTLYIWDIEGDQIFEFDFSKFNDSSKDENQEHSPRSQKRLITSHFWDTVDSRVLTCRIQTIVNQDNKHSYPNDSAIDNLENITVVSMFATPEYGITVHDVRSFPNTNYHLLGVKSPHIIILNLNMDNNDKQVMQMHMREFEELENCDEATQKAIMDFSFYISMANTEDAFKAIKAIKNENIWRSLAKMCIKTKQLNMAILCLGHMKYVRGSKALRNAMNEPDLSLETKIGILAVELELYNDAEKLFYEAKRFDLLCKLLEARNKYPDAINLAKSKNKICEKLSCYQYARSLEQDGDIDKAIDMYTKAECHKFEVPRILINQPSKLQTYLESSSDLEIKNWYAQYVESTGDMESALRLYELAKDTLSVTRLLCYLGREDEACEVVVKSNHAASAYHLAAHYESMNAVPQAVRFYTMAKAYTNAIRVCKENNMTEELWPLVMLATRQTQIDIAKFYEDSDHPDKAVLLYHKAGLLSKAFELSFNTQQYDALQSIIMDIKDDSDPVLIQKCADFFVENNQIFKAVELLATGKKHAEALSLIQEHNITLTGDLAEKMTIVRDENNPDRERQRISLLEKIGEIAFAQGNYHLASKKFTQAGNKVKAMKALLKSGDTEKICFFAQVSRNRDIYIMAGNYLQSLDWQNQPEVLKNIINFYSKGKAMDLLANFYTTCAQVEIDEFQNYGKALDALSQAGRCLSKITSPRDPAVQKRAIEVVNSRMTIIKRFLDIKRLFDEGEPEKAINHVQELLDTFGNNLEASVRMGDLFATVTQHYMRIGDLKKARDSIEELKRLVPNVNLNYFYDSSVLDTLGYQKIVAIDEPASKDNEIEELLDE